jgi:hypothetical protein
MALRVGFDIDGVLADFRSAFQVFLVRGGADEEGAAVDPEQAESAVSQARVKRAWAKVASSHNWWTTLQPYEPAQISRLYALARQLEWEVLFITGRPATLGDTVQFQTQWWLEQHGFYLPAVCTVPGSRGELANAVQLDLVVDDQPLNCTDVISGSPAKALLMLRDRSQLALRDHSTSRGIGVVSSLEEALDVVERLQQVLVEKRGRLVRLSEWFSIPRKEPRHLPLDPRAARAKATQQQGAVAPEPTPRRDE